MAGYTVVCFILNLKDRHNGNILIDEIGHVIHIDFGFMFEIPPGQDKMGIGIEDFSPFRLSEEMLNLMGEDFKKKGQSESFIIYKDLVIKGFMAARDYLKDFISIVEVMIQSGLPCFKGETIKNLKSRFCSNTSDIDAVRYIDKKILSAYNNIFNKIYDIFQNKVEGINC
jgi:phosphatidylinositol 4-kinase A